MARSSIPPLPYGPHRSRIPSWPQATSTPAADQGGCHRAILAGVKVIGVILDQGQADSRLAQLVDLEVYLLTGLHLGTEAVRAGRSE
jgi:hypothetical protein